MANYTMGQLGLNPRGAYNASNTYSRLDVVSYGDNSYVSLTDSNAAVPTNTTNWMVLAEGTSSEPAWNYASLSLGSTPGSYGAGRMRYMKMGNHVFVAGSVNVKPGVNITLFTLPAGYRPTSGTATVIRPCSGSRIARIAVTTSGAFNLEWVKMVRITLPTRSGWNAPSISGRPAHNSYLRLILADMLPASAGSFFIYGNQNKKILFQ